MKSCPECHRPLVDRAPVCPCGRRFTSPFPAGLFLGMALLPLYFACFELRFFQWPFVPYLLVGFACLISATAALALTKHRHVLTMVSESCAVGMAVFSIFPGYWVAGDHMILWAFYTAFPSFAIGAFGAVRLAIRGIPRCTRALRSFLNP